MDMDAIGTFALFLSSGAVGIGLIMLAGWRMKLKMLLERERLQHTSAGAVEELRRQLHDALSHQQSQLDELHERLDFAERVLTRGGTDREEA